MENIFVSGIFAKYPHPAAPRFILANVDIRVDEFIEFLQNNRKQSGYVNLSLREAKPKEGKEKQIYFALNSYEPKGTTERYKPQSLPIDEIQTDTLPY